MKSTRHTKTLRQRIGRFLRDLAYAIDPPAKPGPKRKRAVKTGTPLFDYPPEIGLRAPVYEYPSDTPNAAESEGL